MDLEEYGEVIMVHITIISLHIMPAEIPEWHRVQVIPITEITSYTTGDITAAMVGKINKSGNSKFNFSKFNIVANYYKPGRQLNPVRHHIALPILLCAMINQILGNGILPIM